MPLDTSWDGPWYHTLPMERLMGPVTDGTGILEGIDFPRDSLLNPMELPIALPMGGECPMRRTVHPMDNLMGHRKGSLMNTNMHPVGSPMGPVTSHGKSHGPSLGLRMGGFKSHGTPAGKSHGKGDAPLETCHRVPWEVLWVPQCTPRELPWQARFIPWEA